jgi:uncharacterized protein involved in exopolysaccharide biosynthesis
MLGELRTEIAAERNMRGELERSAQAGSTRLSEHHGKQLKQVTGRLETYQDEINRLERENKGLRQVWRVCVPYITCGQFDGASG